MIQKTASSTAVLVSFPSDHLWKSAESTLTNVGTIMSNEACSMMFPPVCMILSGNLDGGTSTLTSSCVSLFSVFLPLLSTP